MSYPGQSNQQSWQRNQLQNSGQGNMPNQMNPMGMQFSNAPMYNQNISMQSQNQNQNMPFGNPMGNNLNQMGSVPPPPPLFSQTVAYPSARGLNPVAFGANNSQQPNSGQQQHLQHQHNANMVAGQSSNQQNAIGTVTKVHSDCGFVDDEVFFHKNVCKGMMPKVGERVLVEATYNQNSPFKWNATRIQVVSHAHANVNRLQAPPPPLISGGSSKNSGYNAVPPPNEYADQFLRAKSSRQSPSRRSPDRHSGRRELRYREDDEYERKKRREERERDRERHRDRKDTSVEKRERSPVRRVSPKRRRTRTLPRYLVQTPKILLTKTEADVLELRKRYGNLYIPSDFYLSEVRWPESFPAHNPFSIQRPCSFHIMHKNVESLKDFSHLEPQDADYLFSAKVMLMAMPPMSELYEKCLQDDVDRDDDRHFVHPTRLINFLVGLRGKNEAMAIGGPWSPSLDGENPEKDPTVLIKTAIRTCKLLTGVDLSACTQWYRFVELYYHRPEACHKGRLTPARTETVVIFLPDVNSCMPTRFEWNDLQQQYKTTLERILNEDASTADKNSTPASSPTSLALPVAHDSTTVTNASNGTIPDTISNKMATSSPGSLVNANIDDTTNEKDEMVKKEPTHFSELDPKSMKIQDLRNELNARSLSPKGLKPQLVARLTKALKAEKSQDDNKVEDDATEQENSETENADVCEYDKMLDEIAELDMTDIVVLDEYDSTKNEDKDSKKNKRQELDEKERQYLERRYKLPDTPRIIVHPSKTAKSGKFDCTMMSLSLLLDYRPEDTKEHSFEVSLFAELFNEMLMRDFGFNIYKELVALPENSKEKDEKKKDEKKSEDVDRTDSKKETADNEKVEEPKERAKSHERRASDSDRSEKKSSKDKDRERDRDRDRDRERDRDRDRKPSRSRNRDDETDDDAYSTVSAEKRKKLSVIVKPELFLSFIYFDTIHCGFILEKDMEDLFFTLGLNLSRSQIRKLLSKVLSRDIFFYRKLTHATKEDADASKEVGMETKPDEVNIVQLAKGNKYGFPIFKYYDDLTNPPSKKRKRESNNTDSTTESSSEGLVLHNGVLLDVGNLLEQMKRLDKERAETEQLLADLKKQNLELSNTSSKATNKIKDLQNDTRSLSRRLTDAEQNVASLNKKCNEYYTLISSIYDKITPSISKNDRILKNESCRERERDRDREKSRDKDRDKDREKEREKDRDKDREKERDKDREKDCDKEKENHEDSNDTKENRALELKKENSE